MQTLSYTDEYKWIGNYFRKLFEILKLGAFSLTSMDIPRLQNTLDCERNRSRYRRGNILNKSLNLWCGQGLSGRKWLFSICGLFFKRVKCLQWNIYQSSIWESSYETFFQPLNLLFKDEKCQKIENVFLPCCAKFMRIYDLLHFLYLQYRWETLFF